jgi:pimeloyl-ACP methyl ester carboxylesterase
MRGHGRSGRVESGYRVVDYVMDVVNFVQTSVSEPAIIVGHSLGGMVAAGAAELVPDLVRAVVLEDPPFDTMGTWIEQTVYPALFSAYRAMGLAGSTRSTDEVAAELAEIPIQPPGYSQPVRLGDTRDSTAVRFQASCLRRLDPAVLDPIIEGSWLFGFKVSDILAGIRCPALLLQGEVALGGLLADDYAKLVADAIPRCTHIRMPGVGHQIHWMQTELMIRYVLGFLESLD